MSGVMFYILSIIYLLVLYSGYVEMYSTFEKKETKWTEFLSWLLCKEVHTIKEQKKIM